METGVQAPFEAYTDVVKPEWIDDNGHMNMGFYLVVFDMASTPFFHFVGLTQEYRRAQGSTTFAAESHILFRREVREGDRLRFQTRLLDFDGKRLHFAQRMFHADEGYLASSMESMSMHIDRAQRRVAPFAPAIQARLAAVKSAHDTLEPWPEVGRKVAVKGGKPPSA
jgi:acyl-CoA thioester hydrolase